MELAVYAAGTLTYAIRKDRRRTGAGLFMEYDTETGINRCNGESVSACVTCYFGAFRYRYMATSR